ncbi:hypothetical protein ACJX0J_041480, partial [Zea mays]
MPMLSCADPCSSTPTPRAASASSPPTSTPSLGIAPSTSTASATSCVACISLSLSLSLSLHCNPLMFASCVAGSTDGCVAPPPNSNPNPKQDDVGIAGSCSDFLDYLYSSLSSDQVRLFFPAAALGPDTAELVATKAKGLPRITLSLDRVAASALKDVIADFSLALYESYKTRQEHASREQERVSQLMENLDSEREKNEVMQKQLEALSFLDKRKATKPKLVTDKFPSVSGAPPSSDQMIVAVQQQTPVALPSKVPPAKGTKRVAPLPR